MNEFFDEQATLEDIEAFMRGIEYEVNKAKAHLAIALATIKTEGLFYQVARSWKDYVKLERTNLQYRTSLKLAKAGEYFLRYRRELVEEEIRLIGNISKIQGIDPWVADRDPMYFSRLKGLSVRQLQEYNQKKRDEIHVYPKDSYGRNVTVKGASLYMGKEKVRGLNLNDVCKAMEEGKRVVTVFVDDDNHARKVKRALDGLV
jgi:hypothetical protein